MSLNTAVIYGSVRRDRQGIRAAKFLVRKLEERGHDVSLVDPLEFPHPLLDLRYREYEEGTAPAAMQKVHSMLDAADGFVIVSGEYNHGVPPALKNLLDHYLKEYRRKPTAIATYSAGTFAGARVLASLRDTMATVGSISIPAVFTISLIGKSFDDDGNATDPACDERVVRFLDDYEWYATMMKAARLEDA